MAVATFVVTMVETNQQTREQVGPSVFSAISPSLQHEQETRNEELNVLPTQTPMQFGLEQRMEALEGAVRELIHEVRQLKQATMVAAPEVEPPSPPPITGQRKHRSQRRSTRRDNVSRPAFSSREIQLEMRRKPVLCFRCGGVGHFRRNCVVRSSGPGHQSSDTRAVPLVQLAAVSNQQPSIPSSSSPPPKRQATADGIFAEGSVADPGSSLRDDDAIPDVRTRVLPLSLPSYNDEHRQE